MKAKELANELLKHPDFDVERIAEEQGKIIGADYMLQRFLDILKTEVEPQERSDKE